MITLIIQASGWLGTILILVAYYMVSNKKLAADSRAYQILNLVGSIAVGVNVFYQQAWPAVALEVVWCLIAVFALMKIVKKR